MSDDDFKTTADTSRLFNFITYRILSNDDNNSTVVMCSETTQFPRFPVVQKTLTINSPKPSNSTTSLQERRNTIIILLYY